MWLKSLCCWVKVHQRWVKVRQSTVLYSIYAMIQIKMENESGNVTRANASKFQTQSNMRVAMDLCTTRCAPCPCISGHIFMDLHTIKVYDAAQKVVEGKSHGEIAAKEIYCMEFVCPPSFILLFFKSPL